VGCAASLYARDVAPSHDYPLSIPAVVPAGKVLVHNHVAPTSRNGAHGFRYWLADPNPTEYQVEVCPCKWAPELSEHYRVIPLAGSSMPTLR
jgi:hypothetical protein